MSKTKIAINIKHVHMYPTGTESPQLDKDQLDCLEDIAKWRKDGAGEIMVFPVPTKFPEESITSLAASVKNQLESTFAHVIPGYKPNYAPQGMTYFDSATGGMRELFSGITIYQFIHETLHSVKNVRDMRTLCQLATCGTPAMLQAVLKTGGGLNSKQAYEYLCKQASVEPNTEIKWKKCDKEKLDEQMKLLERTMAIATNNMDKLVLINIVLSDDLGTMEETLKETEVGDSTDPEFTGIISTAVYEHLCKHIGRPIKELKREGAVDPTVVV